MLFFVAHPSILKHSAYSKDRLIRHQILCWTVTVYSWLIPCSMTTGLRSNELGLNCKYCNFNRVVIPSDKPCIRLLLRSICVCASLVICVVSNLILMVGFHVRSLLTGGSLWYTKACHTHFRQRVLPCTVDVFKCPSCKMLVPYDISKLF